MAPGRSVSRLTDSRGQLYRVQLGTRVTGITDLLWRGVQAQSRSGCGAVSSSWCSGAEGAVAVTVKYRHRPASGVGSEKIQLAVAVYIRNGDGRNRSPAALTY